MTEKQEDAIEWLGSETGVDAMTLDDLTPAARRAFVEDNGDQLFAFWNHAFNLERHELSERLILKVVPQNTDDIGVALAEKLLDRLATAEFVESVPAWTDLRGCLNWLAGSPAVVAAKASDEAARGSRKKTPEQSEDSSSETPETSHARNEFRERCRKMIEAWVDIWETIRLATRRLELELNWLVATSIARRPLNELLAETYEYPSEALDVGRKGYFEIDKAPLLEDLQVPDGGTSSRLRASACLRFDIEYFYRTKSKQRIRTTRDVFIAPTVDKPPYKPKQKVGDDELEGALIVLDWAARRSRERSDPLHALETDVLRCGLMKAVDRMFACKHRPEVKKRIGELEAMVEQATEEAQ